MSVREPYRGPALFSGGFRPFFLAATLFGLAAIPVWRSVWRGSAGIGGPFLPLDWHVHEMVFGYGAAVVAGFLFTAVPNWTGRMPARGRPLMLLLALWMAGRGAVAGLGALAPMTVLAIDQSFLLAVVLMMAREIVAGRNWRNLRVLVPVSLFWLANVAFHLEAAAEGSAGHGRRAGLALLVVLILLIGGRIIPSFTRNWLAQRGGARLPVPPGRFDAASVVLGAVALAGWVAAPSHPLTALPAAAAAGLHLVRLARWRGIATLRAPLLAMLHLAYLMVPAGFAAVAAAAAGLAEAASPAHLFGIGAVGGMTVAVMMRATLGHTGRPLVAGPVLSAAFALVLAAALVRVAGTALVVGPLDGIDLSAALWTCGFALLCWRIAPWLTRAKPGRRQPSPVPPRA